VPWHFLSQPAQALGAFQLKAAGQRLLAVQLPENTHVYTQVLPLLLVCCGRGCTYCGTHSAAAPLLSMCLSGWCFQPMLRSRSGPVLRVGQRGGIGGLYSLATGPEALPNGAGHLGAWHPEARLLTLWKHGLWCWNFQLLQRVGQEKCKCGRLCSCLNWPSWGTLHGHQKLRM
jgi:hypothetical protein